MTERKNGATIIERQYVRKSVIEDRERKYGATIIERHYVRKSVIEE